MTLYKWSQTAIVDATVDSTINWAEGQSPSSIMMAATAKWRDDITGIATTGGSGIAFTISSNQVITSNTNGFTVQFTPGITNTGAVTLSVDGNTAKPLRFLTGVDLPPGVLVSGSLYQATYRLGSDEWLLHSFDAGRFIIPIGGMIEYCSTTAPNSAFVLPYGQAISRTTYTAYFAMVGTSFGAGDGSTTFNIPDLRGRVTACPDNMGGTLAGRLDTATMSGVGISAVGGAQIHTLTTPQIPSHTHANSLSDPGHAHSGGFLSQSNLNLAAGGNAVPTIVNVGSTGSAGTAITITNAAAGGGGAHNNVQPTIVIPKILRIV